MIYNSLKNMFTLPMSFSKLDHYNLYIFMFISN